MKITIEGQEFELKPINIDTWPNPSEIGYVLCPIKKEENKCIYCSNIALKNKCMCKLCLDKSEKEHREFLPHKGDNLSYYQIQENNLASLEWGVRELLRQQQAKEEPKTSAAQFKVGDFWKFTNGEILRVARVGINIIDFVFNPAKDKTLGYASAWTANIIRYYIKENLCGASTGLFEAAPVEKLDITDWPEKDNESPKKGDIWKTNKGWTVEITKVTDYTYEGNSESGRYYIFGKDFWVANENLHLYKKISNKAQEKPNNTYKPAPDGLYISEEKLKETRFLQRCGSCKHEYIYPDSRVCPVCDSAFYYTLSQIEEQTTIPRAEEKPKNSAPQFQVGQIWEGERAEEFLIIKINEDGFYGCYKSRKPAIFFIPRKQFENEFITTPNQSLDDFPVIPNPNYKGDK